MTKTINAFHPDYIKTYHPDLIKDITAGHAASTNMTKVVQETRKTKPSHGTMMGIAPKKTPVSLKPLEYMTYSRAGTANTKVGSKKFKKGSTK